MVFAWECLLSASKQAKVGDNLPENVPDIGLFFKSFEVSVAAAGTTSAPRVEEMCEARQVILAGALSMSRSLHLRIDGLREHPNITTLLIV